MAAGGSEAKRLFAVAGAVAVAVAVDVVVVVVAIVVVVVVVVAIHRMMDHGSSTLPYFLAFIAFTLME